MNVVDRVQPTLQRDRPDTPFSRILERFFRAQDGVVAAVFVDSEGECIDYVSTLDPYEAKVFGAALLQTTMDLGVFSERTAAGAVISWGLETARYDFVIRRVSDEHLVVVALASGTRNELVWLAMDSLAGLLRHEAGLEAPAWEPVGEAFEVHIREAKGWGYAPQSFRRAGGGLEPLEVLGRWTERGAISTQELVCFRVRCASEELTLVHDASLGRWYRR